jgi:tetratricopeptide (TPR) repeat protein
MRISEVFSFWWSCALLLSLAGCATGSSLRLESEPAGAEVQAWAEGGASAKPESLGVTPLTIEKSRLPADRGGAIQLTLSKSGFQSQNLLIPVATLPAATEVRATLAKLDCSPPETHLNEIASGIANAIERIYSKNYAEAEALVQNLKTRYPKIAVIYDLLGNIHYLRKEYKQALALYRKSKELDPNNARTQRMIDRLSSVYGGTAQGAEVDR